MSFESYINDNRYFVGFLGVSFLAVFLYFGTGISGNTSTEAPSVEVTDNTTPEVIGVTAEKVIPHEGEPVTVTAETPSE
jgi:hypothetical protein